ncbi:hypothetical protein ABPG72_018279 [Tetrahymena utriculariae]
MSNLVKLFQKSQIDWSEKDKAHVGNYLKQLKQFNLNKQSELTEQKIQKCIHELEYQLYQKDEFVFHSYDYCDYIYILLEGSVSQLVSKSELEIEMEKGIIIQIQQLEQLLQHKQLIGQSESDKTDLYIQKINDLNQQLEQDNRFNLSRRIKQIFAKSSVAYCQNESYYFDSNFNRICLFKEQNQVNSGNLIGDYTEEGLRNKSILTSSECHFLKLKASVYYKIFKKEIVQQQKVKQFLKKLDLNQINQSEIEQISFNIERIKVMKDQVVFKQGDKAKQIIFLVQKGSFELKFHLDKSILEESPSTELGQTLETDADNSKSIQNSNSIQQSHQTGINLFKINKSSLNFQEYRLFQVGEGEILGCEELQNSFRNISVISKESKGVLYKIKIKQLRELQDKRIIEKIYQYGQNRMERINRRIQELYSFEQKQQSPLKQINKYYSSCSPSPSNNHLMTNQILEQQQKSPMSNTQTDSTLLICQVTENIEDDNQNQELGSNRMKSIQLLRSHRFQKQNQKAVTPVSTNINTNYSSRRALSMIDSTLLKTQNTFCMSPITQKNVDCSSNNCQTSTNFNSVKSSTNKLFLIGNQQQLRNLQFSDFIQLQQLQEKQDISNYQQQEGVAIGYQLAFSSQPTSPTHSKSIEKKLNYYKKQNSQLKNVMNPPQFFHKSKSFLQTQNQIKIQRQNNHVHAKTTLFQLGANNSQNQIDSKVSQFDSLNTNNQTLSIQANQIQQSILYSKMLKSRLLSFLSNQSSLQKKKQTEKENSNSQQKMIKQQQLSLNRLKHKNVNNFSYLQLSELNKQKKQMLSQKTPCSLNSLPEDNSNNISSNNIFQEAYTMKDLGTSFTANNSPKQKNTISKGIVYYQFQYQQPLIKQRANSINAYQQVKENRISQTNSPQKGINPKSILLSQNNSKYLDISSSCKNNLVSFQETDAKFKQTQSFNNFIADATLNESSKTQNLNSTSNNFFQPQALSLINTLKEQDKPLLNLEFKQNRNAYQPKYKTQNNFYLGKNFNNSQINQQNASSKKINNLQQQQMQYLEISPIKIRNTFRGNSSQEQHVQKDIKKTSTDPGNRSKNKMKSIPQIINQNLQQQQCLN